MKIDFGQKPYTVRVDSLLVGSCFLADRKDAKEGRGIYMVVDGNNGILPYQKIKNKVYAINLESGQLRPFEVSAKVEPVNATVKLG